MIMCPECNERSVGFQDYLCHTCRGIADGKNVCDHCRCVYNPDVWKHYGWNESSGYAPRFAGLCRDCKDIAGESVPSLEPIPVGRAVDEWVDYLRDHYRYLKDPAQEYDYYDIHEPRYESWLSPK